MIEKKITLYIKTEQPKSRQNRKKKRKKKKLEFMQKVVLLSFLFSFAWVTLSYILAWFDKLNPLENLSGIVVSVLIASIVGYVTQNTARSTSFNKYGGLQNGDFISRPTVFSEENNPVGNFGYEADKGIGFFDDSTSNT